MLIGSLNRGPLLPKVCFKQYTGTPSTVVSSSIHLLHWQHPQLLSFAPRDPLGYSRSGGGQLFYIIRFTF